MGLEVGALLLGGAVLAFWLLGAYNRLTRLRGAIVGTFPGLEIQLRKRQSLVRHLAEGVLPAGEPASGQAGAAEPAPMVFDAATRASAEHARAAGRAAREAIERLHKRAVLRAPMGQLQAAEGVLEEALEALSQALRSAALEAPLPRAQAELLERLRQLHKPITYCAEAYNQAVGAYNDALAVFPTSLAARLFRFSPALPLTLQRAAPPVPPDRDDT